MDVFPSLFIAPFWLALSVFHRDGKARPFNGTVSCVVPAHNEENSIYDCVTNLDGNCSEVIVVLDGCTDATIVEVEKARRELKSSSLRVINLSKNGGKSKALNRGIAAAEADVIVTVDADTVIAEGAIQILVSHLNGKDAVCGATRGLWPSTPVQRWKSMCKLFSVNVLRRGMSVAGALFCMPGALTAFRREVFEWVGGFDESFLGAEDMELTWRIMRAGGRIGFCPNAVCFTEDPPGISGQVRQCKKWFMGYIQVLKMHWPLMLHRPGLILVTFQGWILSYILLGLLPFVVLSWPSVILNVFLVAVGLVLLYAVVAILWTRAFHRYYLANVPFALLWIPMAFVIWACWVVYGTKALFTDVGRVVY